MNFDDFYSSKPKYFSEGHSGGLEECIRKYNVSPCRAIDLGAGEGRNSFFLAEQGFDVIAIEPSRVGADKIKEISSKKNLNVNVINSDFLSCYEHLRDVGFLVALTSLEHMTYSDMLESVSIIKQLLVHGGYVYIIAFTEDDPGFIKDKENASECAMFVKHYFKKGELKNLFSDFEILHYDEYIKEDTSHGPKHFHGKAKLFARKK